MVRGMGRKIASEEIQKSRENPTGRKVGDG